MSYSLENMDVNFRKNAMKCCTICAAAIVAVALSANLLITETDLLHNVNLNMFETVAEAPLELVKEHNIEVGDFGITVGVSDYIVLGDSIAVEIFGSNNTDSTWVANSRNFVLSSFNKRAMETRYHYYPENWNNFSVEPGGKYVCRLSFSIPDVQAKIDEGYIFTVSAFRNMPDRSTVDIVVNNEFFEKNP